MDRKFEEFFETVKFTDNLVGRKSPSAILIAEGFVVYEYKDKEIISPAILVRHTIYNQEFAYKLEKGKLSTISPAFFKEGSPSNV